MNDTDETLFSEINATLANNLTAANGAATNGAHEAPWWSVQDAMTISTAVLLFGVAVIAIAAFTTPRDAPLETKLRLFGTIMVLTLVPFLVVAGYGRDQIAAPLGLFGTIAGYLLGRGDRRDAPSAPPPAA